MSKNLSHLSGRKGLSHNLFEELGIAAKSTGSPDQTQMDKLEKEFLFGKANIYGTVSFYDFLKEENKGKKIFVCNGSACMTANTQTKVHDSIGNHFKAEEIGEMCCLGRCHENSSFHYDGNNYSGEAINHIDDVIAKKPILEDKYHIASSGRAVLTTGSIDINDYKKIITDCLQKDSIDLLKELEISGLRGRGGAGFPMSFKLKSCRDSPSETRYIVCNADEGDPGAYSDRYIMEHQAYSLLAGMVISGYLADAQWGVLYIRAEYPESITIIENAVAAFNKNKLSGDQICGADFNFNFKIIKAQGAYICGEETALLSSIEGQRPEVRIRPPYPTQYGLFQKPTVVNNVETLANIPFIMSNGGKAFAQIGTEKSTGTKLISLDGFFNRPGIYEVEMGTPLSEVIYDLGQGFKSPVKAMHIGGPLGGMVPISEISRLTIDFESFSKNGFLLGHASIVCIPESYPMVNYIKHLFQFTAHESCGKCFPCRLGSTRGYEMFEKAMTSDYRIDRTLIDDLLETLESGSLCALGGGLPLPIKNALHYFEVELSPYIKK